ncbi:carboxymuconolactone decarboxylase family protein [Actinokineospora guangxiensis]|uniref:Carboxymuconolactone decarboxylase family protein n=1 Tax=Actinokineospora guangxiensis TaxID=1490288 RepID=A0ABW0EL34_9PSEU
MSAQHTTTRMAPAPAELVRPIMGMPEETSDPDGPLSHIVGSPVPNVLGVLGNHPALLTALDPMFSLLADGTLSLRDSELVILRVAFVVRSTYQWAHHAAIGAKAGISAEEIARVPAGPDAPGWSERDAALLRMVDELRSPEARVSDTTWQQLSAHYDEPQILELLTTVGVYTTLAYVLKSCDVAVEDWFADPPALPEA